MRLKGAATAATALSAASSEACLAPGGFWPRIFGSGSAASCASPSTPAASSCSSQCSHGSGCSCCLERRDKGLTAATRLSAQDQSADPALVGSQRTSSSAAVGLPHPPWCRCTSCLVLWESASRRTLGQRMSGAMTGLQHPSSVWSGNQGLGQLYPASWLRFMACSANLHRAPPKKIIIEYDPEDVDLYIEVADAIEAAFPSMVVEGNEGSGSARAGSFEVTTPEGTVIFSRLAEKRMLGSDALVERLANRPGAAQDEGDDAPRIVCQ